ncbi:MAG: elongation factor P [Chloroflexi bacterium]|nr:elongation factor P [Chloroflexota bacterium]
MEITDVRKNTRLLIDGVPYNVDDADFVKPGKGRAIYRLKLRNLINGSIVDHTYHSADKVDEAHIDYCEMQYLYSEGGNYVFMNTESFEQSYFSEEQLGDRKNFLKEGTVATAAMMADKPIDITLPNFVELLVVGGDVSSKTDTLTAQTKNATLETGYTIAVPPFVKEGDIVKIDTRTGTYVERVSAKK